MRTKFKDNRAPLLTLVGIAMLWLMAADAHAQAQDDPDEIRYAQFEEYYVERKPPLRWHAYGAIPTRYSYGSLQNITGQVDFTESIQANQVYTTGLALEVGASFMRNRGFGFLFRMYGAIMPLTASAQKIADEIASEAKGEPVEDTQVRYGDMAVGLAWAPFSAGNRGLRMRPWIGVDAGIGYLTLDNDGFVENEVGFIADVQVAVDMMWNFNTDPEDRTGSEHGLYFKVALRSPVYIQNLTVPQDMIFMFGVGWFSTIGR